MKKIQLLITGISIALLYFTLSSFQTQVVDDVEINQLINEAVTERINDFRKEKIRKCRASILEKASMQVDSTLRARALRPQIDTLSQLSRPAKPIKPNIRLPKDSFVDLVPILPVELDTVQ